MKWQDIRMTMDLVERVEFVANQVREASGHNLTEPIDINKVTRAGRFHKKISSDPPEFTPQGLLFPEENDKFEISVSMPRPSEENRRLYGAKTLGIRRERYIKFIVAHEIGHSFFFKR